MNEPLKLPLEDGDEFVDRRGRQQKVAGDIAIQGDDPVCYTVRGDWFRRRDAVEVTGLIRDEKNNPIPAAEALHKMPW